MAVIQTITTGIWIIKIPPILPLRLHIVVDTKDKKLFSTWIPDMTPSSVYISGSLQQRQIWTSYKWLSADGSFRQVPSGANTTGIDIRRALVYDLNRKSIKGVSMDTTDTKLRAVGAMMIDFVVVVKRGYRLNLFRDTITNASALRAAVKS